MKLVTHPTRPSISTAALYHAKNTSVNHPHEGLICRVDDDNDHSRTYPQGYVVKEKKAVIGEGIEDFEIASGMVGIIKMTQKSVWISYIQILFIILHGFSFFLLLCIHFTQI